MENADNTKLLAESFFALIGLTSVCSKLVKEIETAPSAVENLKNELVSSGLLSEQSEGTLGILLAAANVLQPFVVLAKSIGKEDFENLTKNVSLLVVPQK
jgi:hypothetical protein